ncbi:putative peptidase M28 [Lupinus albus]|uniref:Vacuolar membrane protease n=1 Tax=Lupinus albus TaxID=3870 RepID=A0A6A4NIC0_LUPAL|nr:putative peptidase M28 [Lupinus albus]
MLELARGVSKNAKELKNGVMFLFNTAEEHAKSFITQHQLSDAIGVAIDLDSLFTEGKKPSVFQGLIPPQGIKSAFDVLGKSTGISATNPSGKGFPFIDKEDQPQVPHTKNHKFDPEKPESFQHLGDNLLPFLLQLDHAVGPAASKGSSAAGKTVFSGADALSHVKALTEMLSRPLDSKADLNPAQQYILKELQKIKGTADGDVDVDLSIFPVKSDDPNLKNVVLRILPKAVSDAKEKAVLVSAHTHADAAASKEAARDKLSSAAFMLELAHGVSKSARELENGVIFLFNSAKEDAKSFITQKNLSETISEVIDLDSLFAESEKPIVYEDHKLDHVKQGSFQDMGDNLLSYLLHLDHTFKG